MFVVQILYSFLKKLYQIQILYMHNENDSTTKQQLLGITVLLIWYKMEEHLKQKLIKLHKYSIANIYELCIRLYIGEIKNRVNDTQDF